MKFIKLDLLTLLISLFILSSCENSSTIGLEIDPTGAVEGALIDSITINSRTVLDDKISSVGLTRHPLGYLKDPTFGATESNLVLSVSVPSNAYTFGTNPVLDSAVLVLNYGGEFYGDSTSNYSIDVHQLSSNLNDELSFMSNREYAYNSTVIGNKSGKVFPTTPFKVLDIVEKKPDTLKAVTPQIRIKLNNAFIQSNILNLTEAGLKTNEDFTRAFKGLQVRINKSGSTGNGGIMFFDFAGANSNLTLYYKKQNATTATAIDTIAVNFPISTASGPVASSIKHDYANTEIATQLSNPTKQYDVTYLQPLAGLRNKISFPYLSKFAAEAGKIIVNKAELVIDLSAGSDVRPFVAAPRLSLYKYDIAEKRQKLVDNSPETSNKGLDPATFGGYFNAVKKQYVFVITSHIQDLISGTAKDYGTFLAPTPSSEALYQIPSLISGARAVIGGFKKNPAVGDKTMKLNIYYTKVN
jgi:hypothetical protein